MNSLQRITEFKARIKQTFLNVETGWDIEFHFTNLRNEIFSMIGTVEIEMKFTEKGILLVEQSTSQYDISEVGHLMQVLISERRSSFKKIETKEL